jgi:ATP-dependent protease ClpP protease subunit
VRAVLTLAGAIGGAANPAYVRSELRQILDCPVRFDSLLIHLIDSPGGDVQTGFEIAEPIRASGLRISASLIEGRANSMASYLACCLPEKCYARPRATAHLHRAHPCNDDGSRTIAPTAGAIASANRATENIIQAYARKTRIYEGDLKRLLDLDKEWPAWELAELGFVDHLLPRGWPPEN